MGIFGTSRSTAGKLGCFGKLPTYGDFMSLNADQPEATALVNWLQEGVAEMASPGSIAADQVIHFIWQPPDARRTLVGALWPSADAAGRRFPFVLFVGVAGGLLERYGPRAILAAESLWRAMHDLYGVTLAAGKPNEQYVAMREAAVPQIPEVRGVNRAYVDRAQAVSFRRDEGIPVGLQLHDLIHLAESLGGSAEPPAFAVRVRLHGSGDPDTEAATWMHVLADRLGAKEFGPALFVRLSRTEGASLFAFNRALSPSDLGFVLAPAEHYRLADHVGFRVAASSAGDAAGVEGFLRAWAVRPPSCSTLLEIGAHGWTPGEVATGPVTIGEPSSGFPAAEARAPAPKTAEQKTAGSDPDTEDQIVTGDVQKILQAHRVNEEATGPVELSAAEIAAAAQAADDAAAETMAAAYAAAADAMAAAATQVPAPTTAPQPEPPPAPPSPAAVTDKVVTDQTTGSAGSDPSAVLARRIRQFASGALLPGRVLRVPLPSTDPAAAPVEAAFYVEDGAKAAPLAGRTPADLDEVERRSEDCAEAKCLLAQLTKIHRECEADLERSIAAACERTPKPN